MVLEPYTGNKMTFAGAHQLFRKERIRNAALKRSLKNIKELAENIADSIKETRA